jgi:hypothetical protein
MNCLLCGAKAEQIAATANHVSIHCPKCGEYDVESAVIATGQLQRLVPERRRDVLDQAKRSAAMGARPLIRPYLLA